MQDFLGPLSTLYWSISPLPDTVVALQDVCAIVDEDVTGAPNLNIGRFGNLALYNRKTIEDEIKSSDIM
jgi:hypothetical protein